MITSRINLIMTVIVLSFFIYGCGTSNAVKGGAIGGAAGGAVGGVVGHYAGNTVLGAIIGAAVGGTAGALIGNYMDNQSEEMKKELNNANIERVGEGIKIVFDSGILFATNSSTLEEGAKVNLEKFAKILNKYPSTNILITGFTDNVGTADYNRALSKRRGNAVFEYSTMLGVSAGRFMVIGYGENEPVASNETAEGKRMNRRVEIAVFANEDLKKKAEKGAL